MSNSIGGISTGLPLQQPMTPATQGTHSGESSSFGSALSDALTGVEDLHKDAQSQVGELLKGDRQDLHNVMIAVEKADVSFQLMMQVRNKIVNAYQEVSRMQF